LQLVKWRNVARYEMFIQRAGGNNIPGLVYVLASHKQNWWRGGGIGIGSLCW